MSLAGLVFWQVFDYWREYQVELHGRYSVARLDALHTYSQQSGRARVSLLFLFTPISCIVLLVLMDVYRLGNPNDGTAKNYVFWIRNYLSVGLMTIGILEQFRNCLPRLPLPTIPLLVITALATAAGIGWQITWSFIIGFPLPFGLLVGTTLWTPVLVAGCYSQWKHALKQDWTLVEDMAEYLVAFLAQLAMTIIYPLYIYVFTNLSGFAQNVFVIVLALIKIFLRNWISRFLNNMDDLKPEVLIFNIEVFNALYVSCSLQSSSSTATTIVVMLIDVLQAIISLSDLDILDKKLKILMAKIPVDAIEPAKFNMLDISTELLLDPSVRNHPKLSSKHRRSLLRRHKNASPQKYAESAVTQGPVDVGVLVNNAVLVKPAGTSNFPDIEELQMKSSASSERPVDRKAFASAAVVPVTNVEDVCHDPVEQAETLIQAETPAPRSTLAKALTLDERATFVKLTGKTLFLTEFVGLVEFTEMMMPIIYTMYLVGMSHLPNRQYYPRLAALSGSQLNSMISSVLIYAGLEIISFVLITTIIRRKFKFSTVHQVAFVLEKQMSGVQTKLVLWTFYVVQCMLFHSGTILRLLR